MEVNSGILVLIVLVIVVLVGGGYVVFVSNPLDSEKQPVLQLMPQQNIIMGRSSVKWRDIQGIGDYFPEDYDSHLDSRSNPHQTVLDQVLNQRDFNIVNADVNDFAGIDSNKIVFNADFNLLYLETGVAGVDTNLFTESEDANNWWRTLLGENNPDTNISKDGLALRSELDANASEKVSHLQLDANLAGVPTHAILDSNRISILDLVKFWVDGNYEIAIKSDTNYQTSSADANAWLQNFLKSGNVTDINAKAIGTTRIDVSGVITAINDLTINRVAGSGGVIINSQAGYNAIIQYKQGGVAKFLSAYSTSDEAYRICSTSIGSGCGYKQNSAGEVAIGSGSIPTSGFPLTIERIGSSGNNYASPVNFLRSTTGTASSGFATGFDFNMENDSGNYALASRIAILWSDATQGAEDTTMTISLSDNGSLGGRLTLNHSGNLTTVGSIQAYSGGNPIGLYSSDAGSGAWIRNDGINMVVSTKQGNIYYGYTGGATLRHTFCQGTICEVYIYGDEGIQLDNDAVKLWLGEGQDASVYYDGSNMIVNPKDVGSGFVSVLGDLRTTNGDLVGDDINGADFLHTSVQTFVDGDTSPCVSGCDVWKTANSGATTITDFDCNPNNGTSKIITVICGDAVTSFTDGSSNEGGFKLAGGFTCSGDDVLQLVWSGSIADYYYYEVSRSVN